MTQLRLIYSFSLLAAIFVVGTYSLPAEDLAVELPHIIAETEGPLESNATTLRQVRGFIFLSQANANRINFMLLPFSYHYRATFRKSAARLSPAVVYLKVLPWTSVIAERKWTYSESHLIVIFLCCLDNIIRSVLTGKSEIPLVRSSCNVQYITEIMLCGFITVGWAMGFVHRKQANPPSA